MEVICFSYFAIRFLMDDPMLQVPLILDRSKVVLPRKMDLAQCAGSLQHLLWKDEAEHLWQYTVSICFTVAKIAGCKVSNFRSKWLKTTVVL